MAGKSHEFWIRPIEPVFFGRPSSFSAGESHHGSSEFPPSPMAFQGLVRSQLLRGVSNPRLNLDDWSKEARDERERLVGNVDSLPEGWQLSGPLPACVEIEKDGYGIEREVLVPWLPVPRYVLRGDEVRGSGKAPSAKPLLSRLAASSQEALTDLGFDPGPSAAHEQRDTSPECWWIGRPDSRAKPLGGWVGPQNLQLVLTGKDLYGWNDEEFAWLPPFVRHEAQPGIALEAGSGRVRQGMLYQLDGLRFSALGGLWGRLEGNLDARIAKHALTESIGAAGRKGRLVRFETAPEHRKDWAQIERGAHLDDADTDGLFWLILVTPAAIGEGRFPRIAADLPDGVRLRFRSALPGKPLTFGGFKMATGESRPNRPFHPAGTAWLFELEGGAAAGKLAALKRLHNRHPLGDPREAGFGFGHTFVGIGPARGNR